MIKTTRIIFFLCFLLTLDIVKPLGYSLSVNFLLLGIIFISSQHPSFITLFLCVIFGFINDIFANNRLSLSLAEFLIVYFFIRYLARYTNIPSQNKYALLVKIILLLLIIFGDIILNSLEVMVFLPLFSLTILIQSLFIYALLAYFANRWLKNDISCNSNHYLRG